MNEFSQLLLWAVNLLLAIILGMVGVMVRMHNESDKEHHTRHENGIKELREKWENLVSREKCK